MALFQLKWLRRLVRKNMKPLPYSTANIWKQRLSIGYALLSWNAFGFVLYAMFTGRADWAKELKTPEELAMSPGKFIIILLTFFRNNKTLEMVVSS